MQDISLTVNGKVVTISVQARTLLVDALREQLRLTGTHVGCDTSQCGCCTVRLNGSAVKSCTVLAIQAAGARVDTIEGLATGAELHAVQEAFSQCHGLQCGYCTPGMIMATVELLEHSPIPTIEEIRHGLAGNFCRCTGYINIEKAVQQAAASLRTSREQQPGSDTSP